MEVRRHKRNMTGKSVLCRRNCQGFHLVRSRHAHGGTGEITSKGQARTKEVGYHDKMCVIDGQLEENDWKQGGILGGY